MKHITAPTQFPDGEHLAVIVFTTKTTRDFGGIYCSYIIFDSKQELSDYILKHPDTPYKVITARAKNVEIDVKIS